MQVVHAYSWGIVSPRSRSSLPSSEWWEMTQPMLPLFVLPVGVALFHDVEVVHEARPNDGVWAHVTVWNVPYDVTNWVAVNVESVVYGESG